jgi:DNA-binding beta-propeller fold protein YncE
LDSGLALLGERGLAGHVPNDLDIAGDRLYVVNSGDNTIGAIDLTSGRTIGCIDLGKSTNPWELFLDPSDPDRGWVSSFVSGEVLEVSLSELRVLRRKIVGPAAEGILVGTDRVVVSLTGFEGTEGSFGQGYVVFLDKASLAEVARLAVPTNPQFLFTGADARIHCVCTGNFGSTTGRVVRLEADGSAVRDTLALGGSPSRAALAGNGVAYVAAFYGGAMAYDTVSFTALRDATNPILSEPGYSDVAVVGDRVFLTNFDLDAVVEWDASLEEVVGGFLAGDGPVAVAVRPR